jgi:hypothetical protein
MRVVIIYRDKSDHARAVLSFVRDIKSRYPDRYIELIDVETRDGMAMANLYDIVRYPAVLVVGMDGSLMQQWQGEPLPLIDEAISYAVAA